MIDLLHTVDWIVDEPRDCARRFAELLPIPPAPAKWVHHLEAHDYEAVFMKTTSDLTRAPTRVEFIRALDGPPGGSGCSAAPVRLVQSLQRPRPQLTHATVFCVSDFEAYTEQLRQRGTEVWVEPVCAHLPHNRAWVGWTFDGSRWVPGSDHGLFLEYIPTAVLGPRVSASVADAVDVASPRITRRVQLVDDLDAAVSMLEGRLGLGTDGPIALDRDLGARTATFRCRHPASAALVLAEPSGASGSASDYFGEWGAGPWITSLSVEDPASVADLVAAGGGRRARHFEQPVVEIPPGLLVQLQSP